MPQKNIKPEINLFFYNRFSWIAIFFILFSLIVYASNASIHKLDVHFIFFAFISYFFWTSIGALLLILPKRLANFFIAILAILWSILILTAPAFFKEFKEFLSVGLVILLKEQPVYFWGYVHQITHTFWQISAIILLSVLLFYFFRIRERPQNISYKIVLGLALFVLLFNNFMLNKKRHVFSNAFLPVDIHTFYALKKGVKSHSDEKPLKHILTSDWDKSLPDTSNEKYNIVLVVFESMSKVPMPFYGFDNKYMPFLSQWINKEHDQFLLFKNALSVSGATDISMPTIYTGIGPERDYLQLIKAPFLWDYAKKAGYETFLINTQSQEWKHMDQFVNDKNVDHYYYPEKLKMSFINDIGTDGISLIKKLKPEILKLKTPFFLYFNTNATHTPYQDHSPMIKDFKGITSRYGKALYITDQTVKTLVETLKEKGGLDRTIFIFTADHGYYIAKRRSRLSSFFKETLDIPMMIRLPKKWIESHPSSYQILKQNLNKRVTNLDIAPTIFELIFDQKPDKKTGFSGKSLFTPINNKRTIIALSTNDTRRWSSEGFGIYKDSVSYIFHDNTGFHFYNVKKDSLQQHDLIREMSEKQKKYFDSLIAHQKYLKAVLQRASNNKAQK